ncbi:acetyl-CoA C-acyltransferase, partial [Pelomonas sp. HMWF004]
MPDFARPMHDTWLLAGARTPWVDYCGALAAVSPTDLGIHAARAAIERSGLDAAAIGSCVVASMAHADFDAYVLPRHVGLYA